MLPGCTSSPDHDYTIPDARLIHKYREYALTPVASNQMRKCRAVALDCEMANVEGGKREVVLLCAVDYLSGETLINRFVDPTKRVVNWRTRFSGVTAKAMNAARARGEALKGWKEARAELWKHVDASTILIGHSLNHDLDVLKMVHAKIVDSGILVRNAVGSGTGRQWGLKILCDMFLNIHVQTDNNKGHDCLEDVFAARELVLWATQNPQKLETWGELQDQLEKQKKEKTGERPRDKQDVKNKKPDGKEVTGKRPKRKQQPKKKAQTPKVSEGGTKDKVDNSFYDGDEILHWSDIAEDLGWPHPDTGYDPWSD